MNKRIVEFYRMEYIVKKTNRKTLALEIDSSASLIVRAPKKMPETEIIRFIQEKKVWITRTMRAMQEVQGATKQVDYTPGSKLWFLGQQYTLVFSDTVLVIMVEKNEIHIPQKYKNQAKKYLYAWYRRRAEMIMVTRIHCLAHDFGYQVSGVRITAATKTRWGSCSPTNTISLAWRLIQAPMSVVEYVLIHELVHTVHKNHGPLFWKTVAKHCPDYRDKKKWLSDHGTLLRI